MRRNIGPWQTVDVPATVTCACGRRVGEVPAGHTVTRSIAGETMEFRCDKCGRVVRVGVRRER